MEMDEQQQKRRPRVLKVVTTTHVDGDLTITGETVTVRATCYGADNRGCGGVLEWPLEYVSTKPTEEGGTTDTYGLATPDAVCPKCGLVYSLDAKDIPTVEAG